MGYVKNTEDIPENEMGTDGSKGKGKTSSKIKAQSELLLEAAANHFKTHGLDNLDPEKFQKAVLEYVQGKTVEQLQMENTKVKREKIVKPIQDSAAPKTTPEVVEIKSDEEDWTNMEEDNKSRGSGPP